MGQKMGDEWVLRGARQNYLLHMCKDLYFSNHSGQLFGAFFLQKDVFVQSPQVVEKVWGVEWEEITMLILADEYRKPQRVLSYPY